MLASASRPAPSRCCTRGRRTAKLSVDDLALEVRWSFGDDPHRVSDIGVIIDWPSLPPARLAAARRARELCTIHATLTHPPRIEILAASELAAHEHAQSPAAGCDRRPCVRFTVWPEEASPRPWVGRAYTVVFDGDCKVCTRLAKVLRAWDTGDALEVVSSQQLGVMARFPWIPARAYIEALQLVRADGTTWQGAAAIEECSTSCPAAGWPPGCSAALRPHPRRPLLQVVRPQPLQDGLRQEPASRARSTSSGTRPSASASAARPGVDPGTRRAGGREVWQRPLGEPRPETDQRPALIRSAFSDRLRRITSSSQRWTSAASPSLQ